MDYGSTTFVKSVPLKERQQARTQGCFEFKKLVKNLPNCANQNRGNLQENEGVHSKLTSSKSAPTFQQKWIEIRPDKKVIQKKPTPNTGGAVMQSSQMPASVMNTNTMIKKPIRNTNSAVHRSIEDPRTLNLKRAPSKTTILITPQNRKVPRLIRTQRDLSAPGNENPSTQKGPQSYLTIRSFPNGTAEQWDPSPSPTFRVQRFEESEFEAFQNRTNTDQSRPAGSNPKSFEIRKSSSGSFRVARPIILSNSQNQRNHVRVQPQPESKPEPAVRPIVLTKTSSAGFRVESRASPIPAPSSTLDMSTQKYEPVSDPNPNPPDETSSISYSSRENSGKSSSNQNTSEASHPSTPPQPSPESEGRNESESESSNSSDQGQEIPEDPSSASPASSEEIQQSSGTTGASGDSLNPSKKKRGRPKKEPSERAPPKPRKPRTPKAPGESKQRKKPKILDKTDDKPNEKTEMLNKDVRKSSKDTVSSVSTSLVADPSSLGLATFPHHPQPSTSTASQGASISNCASQSLSILDGYVLDPDEPEPASELEQLEQWLNSRHDLIDAIAAEDPFPDIKDMDDFVHFSDTDYSNPLSPENQGAAAAFQSRPLSSASSSQHDISQSISEDHGYSYRQTQTSIKHESLFDGFDPTHSNPQYANNPRTFRNGPMSIPNQPPFVAGPVMTVQNCHRCCVPVRTHRLMDHILCHYGIDFGPSAPFFACRFCRYDSFDWSDAQHHSQTFHQVSGGFFDRYEAMKAACFPPIPVQVRPPVMPHPVSTSHMR